MKDTIKKVTRQPTEWKKMFANFISDKGPVPGIHGELFQLNNKLQAIQLKMNKVFE